MITEEKESSVQEKDFIEKTKEEKTVQDYVDFVTHLRENHTLKHNCTQAILVAFADDMGLSEVKARALGTHFGLGMGCGHTCGVVTGAMTALSAMECEKSDSATFMKDFLEKYGSYECRTLLATCKERGEPRGEHCNRLIFQGVEDVAKLWKQRQEQDALLEL